MENVDQMLEQMALDGQGQRAEVSFGGQQGLEPVGRGNKPSIARVRYTHEAMIEEIVRNPAVSQGELARHFGFSDAWISTVVNSDAFQAKLALVKEELINPELRVQLNERFKALATQSVKVLMEKLAKPADQVSDQLALRAAELGAKALGMGGHQAAPTVVINSTERLQSLAGRLVGLMGQPAQGGQVVDVQAREVLP